MQPLDEKRYNELAEKWLNGTITPEEEMEFARWYNAGQDKEIHIPAEFAGSEEALRKRMLSAILRQKETPVVPLFRRTFVRIAAAAILLLIAGGSLYYFLRQPAKQTSVAQLREYPGKNENAPGTRAVLTLADGTQVNLDATQNGAIILQGGAEVIKAGSVLTYNKKTDNKELLYHTMATKRGGQYQVVLADGTRVWLNAASSIKFPTTFSGNERKVELNGEGYFEVAKNSKQPFKVVANGVEVDVLGTHFNVMAYQEEEAVKTTLLEGKVKVLTEILKPGQQAVLTHDARLTVHEVQPDEVIAWKNGLFRFEGADIRAVMREIERWYNISVTYEGAMNNKRVTGNLSRGTTVQEVMQMLEYTSGIKYTINGNRITISKQ